MLALLEKEAAQKDEKALELKRLHEEYLATAKLARVMVPTLVPELQVSDVDRACVHLVWSLKPPHFFFLFAFLPSL